MFKIPTSYKNMEALNPRQRSTRKKVVFIMGATGTGKSRLSIDLAARFQAEIINSDKIQIHKGLDIVTNKVTKKDQCGVPHHLLDILSPNVDFPAKNFCVTATRAVESILQKGMVDEVRAIFDLNNTDYSRGIRRAIGVPELDKYFRAETRLDEPGRVRELRRALNEIKENTCKLASRQLNKIYRLKDLKGWDLNRLDATEVFSQRSPDRADEVWDKVVTRPAVKIVYKFVTSDFNSGDDMVTRKLNLCY